MDVEQYLQSEQAVADSMNHCGTVVINGAHNRWIRRTIGPWREIHLCPAWVQACLPKVYYRPEGDRYIVTDLGEALRALRLKTGHLSPVTGLTIDQAIHGPEDCDFLRSGDALFMHCDPAGLPRAICAVMLAAYKVARLEVPR